MKTISPWRGEVAGISARLRPLIKSNTSALLEYLYLHITFPLLFSSGSHYGPTHNGIFRIRNLRDHGIEVPLLIPHTLSRISGLTAFPIFPFFKDCRHLYLYHSIFRPYIVVEGAFFCACMPHFRCMARTHIFYVSSFFVDGPRPHDY